MNLSRRGLLGMLAAGAGAAIIRTPGLLMPIKPTLVGDVSTWAPVHGESELSLHYAGGRVVKIPTGAQADLFSEMARALSHFGSQGAERFIAHPDVTARLERQAIRDALIFKAAGSLMQPKFIGDILVMRTFRGVPILHEPSAIQSEGWPGGVLSTLKPLIRVNA